MSNFEWKVIGSSFVLHEDGKPTDTSVIFEGGWQICENGNMVEIDAYLPSEAIGFCNGFKGIEAQYDEEKGREEIIKYLNEEIVHSLDSILDDISKARREIATLNGTRRNVFYSLGYETVEVGLQLSYELACKALDRFKDTKNHLAYEEG